MSNYLYNCDSEKQMTNVTDHTSLKGILHPKMKILSSIHQVFANLYEFLSSAEHKGRYFEERLEL